VKVVFHPDFHDVYSADPAAESGRLKPAERALGARHEIVVPRPIDAATARIVHGREHVEEVRSEGRIWRMALLAAGGALEAARLAAGGEPAFALVRPPGHHASPSSA
jgi:acetoin utilization deacetylase AcuC-like enzyme